MAQDSEKKIDVKLELESGIESKKPKAQDLRDKSFNDYARDLDRAESSLSSTANDLERATSTGYNPNRELYNTGAKNVPRPSGLAKKDGSKLENSKNNNSSSTSQSSKPISGSNSTNNYNPHESAPDINKDYGSSAPQNSSNKQVRPQETRSNNVNNNDYNDNYGQSNYQHVMPPSNDGLQRKNDLEEGNDKKGPQDEMNHQDEKQIGETSNEEQDTKSNDIDKNGLKDNSSRDDELNPEAPQNLDKSKINDQNQSQTGNGYGALRNRLNGRNANDDRVRQNMDHSKRIQQGEAGEKSKTRPLSSGSINEMSAPSLSNRIKDKFRNILGGKADSKDDVSDNSNGRNDRSSKNPFNKAMGAAKSAIFNFLKANPHIAVILIVIILFFLILIISNLSDEAINGGGGNGSKCNYSLNGVLSTGNVNLEGLQVELVNCDAKPNNYTVLETVDFEKYVVGVALAEVGYSPSNPEYFKTEIVAARNFALTRNASMCPGNPDNCFYGYNPNTGKIRMRACEADQVYWDYDKDIYRYDRGAISLYSPEINSGTVWKSALDENTKAEVSTVANEVKGKVLLDSSGNVAHTNYINTDQQEWSRLASEGHTYDEILSSYYGGGTMSGASCSSGTIDYGNYVLASDGDTILHEPLESFLSKQGTSLEAFNGLIESNVRKAGYGTRAGVVAAAVTLIAELGNNYNVKVPYYWGGGHADGVVDGALGYWGSTQCHTYANNQSYNYCGLDCSGFVPWAIKNGGFNIAQMLAGGFQNLSGAQRVALTNSAVLEPGDLLESSGHIVLVVGIEESSGTYICAEASGNSAGVLFTKRAFNSSGYWGVKMDGFYSTHQRSD